MTNVLPPPSPSEVRPPLAPEGWAPERPPPPPSRSRRRRPARRHSAYDVIIVGVICYLAAALLNAEGLRDRARELPFGTRRDVLVALSSGLAGVSDAIGIDHLDGAVARLRDAEGEGDDDGSDVVALPEVTVPPTRPASPDPAVTATAAPQTPSSAPTDPATTTATAPATAPAVPAVPATPTVTAAPATTVTAVTTSPTVSPYTVVRTPTAEAPLTVWVGGDSLSQGLGWAMERIGADTGLLTASGEGRVSTGLARPDFFDWPAEIQRVVADDDPEVMVVMFGANDPQPVQTETGTARFGTPEWEAEYRLRVQAAMALGSAGRRLIWVGEPVVRDPSLDARMQVIDRIQREEAATFPNVSFIDARTLFAGADGLYAEVLPAADGSPLDLRAGDGVHPNEAGYTRLARLARAEIERLTDPAQAPLPIAPAALGGAALV